MGSYAMPPRQMNLISNGWPPAPTKAVPTTSPVGGSGFGKVSSIEISPAPKGYEQKYNTIFTAEAVQFLADLVATFGVRVDGILRHRKLHKLTLDDRNELPNFSPDRSGLDRPWQINPLPARLQNRHLDLGDVSPSNAEHLKKALQSPVQGIQVDYDDGCCPSWKNMIEGIYNVIAITRNQFFPHEVPSIASAPILMMRPRAWNMNEHNVLVNGKEIPAPLMDFGLLIFHVGQTLAKHGAGPFFYLSKVEGGIEARLWNDIFVWSQMELGIPRGTIKACVLIECILAAFEMEEILYELREHSLGLNCGIWDYCASLVNKFGDREQFLLPDRNKYVSLDKPFLTAYMKLVVQTCHRHGAPATGGMAALTLPQTLSKSDKTAKIEGVCKAKLLEIKLGIDGFMVYDTELCSWMNELWERFGSDGGVNQIGTVLHSNFKTSATDLLTIPVGGITTGGLTHNIRVGILYIYSWLANAQGHFVLNGLVEDSATAEISRSQVWQWILHLQHLEDGSHELITKQLVTRLSWNMYQEYARNSEYDAYLLEGSTKIFLELVTAFEPPEFITTFLYNHSTFRAIQQT